MTDSLPSKSRFITFEGPEGCGKSTHIGLLADKLRSLGQEVVTTREPGGTPLCETIRGLLQFDKGGESPCPASEVLLFAASRAQLVQTFIRPALERGAWVLCDRFVDSTYAYQGYGRGYDLASLRSINEFAMGGTFPSLTLLLVTDLKTEQERIETRGGASDRFEREALAFHERVRKGFYALADAEPGRFRTIRTDQTIEKTRETIWETVREAFSL